MKQKGSVGYITKQYLIASLYDYVCKCALSLLFMLQSVCSDSWNMASVGGNGTAFPSSYSSMFLNCGSFGMHHRDTLVSISLVLMVSLIVSINLLFLCQTLINIYVATSKTVFLTCSYDIKAL